ncbi:MAG: hypothetical protein ABWY11_01325 [Umezawaea sp.]
MRRRGATAVLAMSSYPQQYVDECRARIDAQVEAYRAVVAAGGAGAPFKAAADAFEPVFFNNLLLALESHFVHRLRAKEAKDGNPLNEVRVLSSSLVSAGGVFTADKTIKMNPEHTVLKYRVGDVIAVREADFVALAKAYFAELELKYRESA